MSHTIYGGIAKNGIDIDDMVNDSRDIFYESGHDGYFIRLSGHFVKEGEEDVHKPAMAVFSYEEPFEPVYAIHLPENFSDFQDESGNEDPSKAAFKAALEKIREEFRSFIKKGD